MVNITKELKSFLIWSNCPSGSFLIIRDQENETTPPLSYANTLHGQTLLLQLVSFSLKKRDLITQFDALIERLKDSVIEIINANKERIGSHIHVMHFFNSF